MERSLKSLCRMKQDIRRRPRALITDYIWKVRESLGVCEGQVLAISDYNRRLSWGKHKRLQRAHLMFGEITALFDASKVEEAMALTVQFSKAIHQAALDEGDWRVAWHLAVLTDPLARGGTEHELETMAA